jgi:hypothetical protein
MRAFASGAVGKYDPDSQPGGRHKHGYISPDNGEIRGSAGEIAAPELMRIRPGPRRERAVR